jgi:hypothetical protein
MTESARGAARELCEEYRLNSDDENIFVEIIDRHFPGYHKLREALQGSHSLLAELVKGRERFKADLPMWIESRIERAKQLITRVEAALAVPRAELLDSPLTSAVTDAQVAIAAALNHERFSPLSKECRESLAEALERLRTEKGGAN